MDQVARIGFLTVFLCYLSNLQAAYVGQSTKLTKDPKSLVDTTLAVQVETSAPAQPANAEN
ncbi:hypothetical protein [Candidatus Odyssella thessalonicensis]|uniref:hypothetical protein n=1 Tax=Candidatus Odyssella thessalonicensis TaxID=84647 RepID=UPI000225B753|nr:hypothetical protein [Candidatus Odyssella thessalonicensis]